MLDEFLCLLLFNFASGKRFSSVGWTGGPKYPALSSTVLLFSISLTAGFRFSSKKQKK